MCVYLGFGGEEGGVSSTEKPEEVELPTSESGVTQEIRGDVRKAGTYLK